jgi:hypothetical protein
MAGVTGDGKELLTLTMVLAFCNGVLVTTSWWTNVTVLMCGSSELNADCRLLVSSNRPFCVT